MRRQIPNDVHIVLEKPQVNPYAIDKIQLSQLAAVDDLLHFLDRGRIDEGVIDHEHALHLARSSDHLLGVRRRGGKRLFNQYVLAGVEGSQSQGRMGMHRRGDGHRVDVGPFEQRLELGDGAHVRKVRKRRLQARFVLVADGHQPGRRTSDEVANQVRPPIPGPNNGDANHVLTWVTESVLDELLNG
ncbi:MAG: hypothetical protein WD063_03600 [Pirellulales bacterium]